VMHAVISGPMSVRTGRENRHSENRTFPSTQLCMDSEAMESVLLSESNKAPDDGALLHLGEQSPTPIAQGMLNCSWVNPDICSRFQRRGMQQRVRDALQRMIDVAQPLRPRIICGTTELLLAQETVDADISRVTYAAPRDSAELVTSWVFQCHRYRSRRSRTLREAGKLCHSDSSIAPNKRRRVKIHSSG
jgi:hypothetical protein